MSRVRTKIMGTKIDAVNRSQVMDIISRFLQDGQHHVVTPNAEFVLQARKNKGFQMILNSADLAVLDGSGPLIASWFTSVKLKDIIPGSDLVTEILKLANQKKLRVAVLNLEGSLSTPDEIKQAVIAKYTQIDLKVLPVSSEQINSSKESITALKEIDPQILFVGFGSPMQDIWIDKNLKQLPGVSVAMGIGGSFDFISGRRQRAPKAFRKSGLEWLFRLFSKPKGGEYHFGKRMQKIFRSVIVFPIIFVFTFNRG